MRLKAMGTAVLMSMAIAGCAAPPQSDPPLPSGQLISGRAEVVIGDNPQQKLDNVACHPNSTGIDIVVGRGDETIAMIVKNDSAPRPAGVAINDFDGFSGSYWDGLQGSADLSVRGQTYDFTGLAAGFRSGEPGARVEERFSIRAAC